VKERRVSRQLVARKLGENTESTESRVEGQARPECGKPSFVRTRTLASQDRSWPELKQFLPTGRVNDGGHSAENLHVNR